MDKEEYLYGVYRKDIKHIPQDVIDSRIRALDCMLNDLLEVNYEERDGVRINEIIKAKNFWRQFEKIEGDKND